MDYDGWLRLSDYPDDVPPSLSIEIRRARWYEYAYCLLTHPDPIYKVCAALALISVVLGVVSVLLGVIAVVPR